MSGERATLRHTVATLAYRAAKACRGAPDDFGDFQAGESTRTPVEILAHMGDLMDWGLSLARGEQVWDPKPPSTWDDGVRRFFAAIEALDAYLASAEPLELPVGKLFQGPVADALTHVGQINLLRRVAGSPVRGENYLGAGVEVGTVGLQQPEPRWEFD